MRNFCKLIFISCLSLLTSCSKNEVVTGSPVGTNVNFETLQGSISCDETQLAGGQLVKVTVGLPRTFNVDVLVENSAFVRETGKRTRKSVLIPAGLTSAEMMMPIPAGDQPILPFLMNVDMYLTAITTAPDVVPKGFSGSQYSIVSNILNFGFGDASFTAVNGKRLGVRFDFIDPNAGGNPVFNNLDLKVTKVGFPSFTVSPLSAVNAEVYGTVKATTRYESLYFNNIGADATYIVEIYAQRLISTPLSVPFRFTLRFANEETRVFTGVLNNAVVVLPAGSNSVAKLKIEKSSAVVNGQTVYKYIASQL